MLKTSHHFCCRPHIVENQFAGTLIVLNKCFVCSFTKQAFLFLPDHTLYTWKHPIQSTHKTVCGVYYIFSISSSDFLPCKQALIVSCETCCRAQSAQALLELCCCQTSAALFWRTEAAPPWPFTERHHTVPTVSASAHLHVTMLVSGRCCSWTSQATVWTGWGRARASGGEKVNKSLCSRWRAVLLFVLPVSGCVCLILTLMLQILCQPANPFICIFSFQTVQTYWTLGISQHFMDAWYKN